MMRKSFLNSKHFVISFLFLILVTTDGFGQKFILLQKGSNQKSRLKFEIGEEFTYKSTTYDFFVTDIIIDIRNDIIILSENILQPKDITAVYVKHKDPRNATLKNLSFLGMGAGLIFFTGGIINSLYHYGDLSQTPNSLGLSAGLFGAGYLFSKLQYKEFKHQGKNKIQLVILYGD
ncbi:hypothetical protein [Aquiflexum sp.]|uniref:hypothetical protein n=1 Tax=Aquiflexum sp. TaxID=1872584 RepID=UPI00359406D0